MVLISLYKKVLKDIVYVLHSCIPMNGAKRNPMQLLTKLPCSHCFSRIIFLFSACCDIKQANEIQMFVSDLNSIMGALSFYLLEFYTNTTYNSNIIKSLCLNNK